MINSLRALFAVKPKQQAEPIKAELSEADKSRALHAKLKQSWDAARTAAGLTTFDMVECYESALGAVYYRFVNILDLTEQRHFELSKISQALKLGLSDEYLDALTARLSKALDEGNAALAKSLVQDLNHRRTALPEQKQMLKLGMLYLVRHDENPYTYNPISEADKLKDIEQDPELRGFFLAFAWDLTKVMVKGRLDALGVHSGLDFRDYQQMINKENIS
jgi:hypothetical protein